MRVVLKDRPSVLIALLLLTLVLGYVSLAGWPDGAWQIALRIVVGVVALYLLFEIASAFIFAVNTKYKEQALAKARELEQVQAQAQQESSRREIEVANRLRETRTVANELLQTQIDFHQDQLTTYREAIERVIDRQAPLYSEELEVTITVGRTDEEDLIRERITTIPKPQLVHTSRRLIVPTTNEGVTHLSDVDAVWAVENRHASLTVLPLAERSRYLRVWVIFEPGITERVVWSASYRPKGIWAPLRAGRPDYLIWRDSLPAGEDGTSPLADFKIKFLFPGEGPKPVVVEVNNYGTLVEADRAGEGEPWVVEWRDRKPAGRKYKWDLLIPSEGPRE